MVINELKQAKKKKLRLQHSAEAKQPFTGESCGNESDIDNSDAVDLYNQ